MGCFPVYAGESATAARLGGFLWVMVLYCVYHFVPGRGPAAQRSPSHRSGVPKEAEKHSLERVLFCFPKTGGVTSGMFSPNTGTGFPV